MSTAETEHDTDTPAPIEWLGPEPSPERPGCLLVHGFTGTPRDVRPLGEHLVGLGWPVAVPRLRGHGESWRALAPARLAHWREDVARAARAIHERSGKPVQLVGLSMGALLCFDLARRDVVPVASVVSMAAPLELGPAARTLAGWSARLDPDQAHGLAWPKATSRVSPDDGARSGPDATPLRALHELFGLMDEVRANLDAIDVPVLVLQGRRDPTASADNATRLANRLKRARVRLVVLDEGEHVLPRSRSAARVAAEVETFLDGSVA